jgi:hypothetical protein
MKKIKLLNISIKLYFDYIFIFLKIRINGLLKIF